MQASRLHNIHPLIVPFFWPLIRSKASENSLTLSGVSVEDEGTYVCVVENTVGRAEREIILRVYGRW